MVVETSSSSSAIDPAAGIMNLDHLIFVVQENRSFDHFLGALKTDAGYAGKAKVEGLSGTESNPAPDGSSVAAFKMANFTPEDPPHGWDAVHAQLNGGKNDGFVIAQRDLELGGPGELLGTRQTGLARMRVADLVRDARLLPRVDEAAALMLARYRDRIAPLAARWIGRDERYGRVG